MFASPFPRNQENRNDLSFAPEHREIFPTPRMQGDGRAGGERQKEGGGHKQHLLVVFLIGAGRERACGREREGGGILVITEYGRQRFRSPCYIVINA